ncbi:hypothetical protein [Ellagibacter isourolithinifaciens]|uniref:hypothetical protein n=1 Tax=Ellagibacter isourolithinifaciens TaxID=2137581 RepID=UPI003A8F62FE
MPSSVDVGDGVTISISGGSFTFDFHEHKENEDIYFTYDYDSSGTLAKSQAHDSPLTSCHRGTVIRHLIRQKSAPHQFAARFA